MGKIIPKDIEVVVGYYGGVGTTFFLDFVAQFKKTNHPQDEDKIKQLGMPPVSFNKDIQTDPQNTQNFHPKYANDTV